MERRNAKTFLFFKGSSLCPKPCWPADLVLDMEEGQLARMEPTFHPACWPTGIFSLVRREFGRVRIRACTPMHTGPGRRTPTAPSGPSVLECISGTEYSLVSHLQESHAGFEAPRKRHEGGSIYSQMLLLLKLSEYAVRTYHPNEGNRLRNEAAARTHRRRLVNDLPRHARFRRAAHTTFRLPFKPRSTSLVILPWHSSSIQRLTSQNSDAA